VRGNVVLLCLGLTAAPGCFGSFRLVNTVYDFNRDLSERILVQEVVFIALLVVQVYSVAFVADAVVFNVLEWITGDNPVSQGPGETRLATLPDGRTVAVIPDGEDVLIAIDGEPTRRLVRQDGMLLLMQGGVTLARLELSPEGLQVVDAAGAVHPVGAAELEQMQLALSP
jgi:hypothetical protein